MDLLLEGLPKILIISESTANRDVYKKYLRIAFGECCKFIESPYGEQGLELCCSQEPDCVILDALLADIHSIEFLERSKEIKNFPNTQIVLLLAKNTEIKISELKPLGAQHYLLKSLLTPERLCAKVVKAVKTSKRQRKEKLSVPNHQAA